MALWLLIGCLGCGMLTASGPGTGDESIRAEYEQRKQAAKLDPASQVELALWCEHHGLTTERNRHLSLAALRDPNNARVRSLLGQVPDGDGWKRVDEAAAEDKRVGDPILEEYRSRRDRIKDTDADHEKLADWCAQNGLVDEADAHLRAALRIDPKRTSVWKKLGYKRLGGRWVTDELLAAEKVEAETQKQANEFWSARLAGLLKDRRDRSKATDAQAALDEIRDPRAVPAIWKQVVLGKNGDPELGIRMLARQDAPETSRLLAMLAVGHNADRVRNQAAQVLRCRDPREFAGPLIELMGEPIAYEVRPVGGPGSPGVLFINGEQAILRRSYVLPSMNLPAMALTFVSGPDGLPAAFNSFEMSQIAQATQRSSARNQSPIGPVSPGARSDLGILNRTALGQRIDQQTGTALDVNLFRQAEERAQFVMLETMRATQATQAQLDADVARIEQYNERVRTVNARINQVLGSFASIGRDAGPEPWRAWHQDTLGYRYDPPPRPINPADKPVVDEFVLSDYSGFFRPVHSSCFAAGTPVHTRDGLVPIEQLRIGDQVLSLDARTGKLDYKPVVVVLHNPPSETLKIRSGGETVTTTTIHRFWKAGQGWSLARDLAEGDPLRGVRGIHPIESIEPGQVMPVFNLEVADNGTFFVGQSGWLVRDHTLPSFRERPYDAEIQP